MECQAARQDTICLLGLLLSIKLEIWVVETLLLVPPLSFYAKWVVATGPSGWAIYLFWAAFQGGWSSCPQDTDVLLCLFWFLPVLACHWEIAGGNGSQPASLTEAGWQMEYNLWDSGRNIGLSTCANTYWTQTKKKWIFLQSQAKISGFTLQGKYGTSSCEPPALWIWSFVHCIFAWVSAQAGCDWIFQSIFMQRINKISKEKASCVSSWGMPILTLSI